MSANLSNQLAFELVEMKEPEGNVFTLPKFLTVFDTILNIFILHLQILVSELMFWPSVL